LGMGMARAAFDDMTVTLAKALLTSGDACVRVPRVLLPMFRESQRRAQRRHRAAGAATNTVANACQSDNPHPLMHAKESKGPNGATACGGAPA
jgi:hypothetical protein